MPAEVDALRVKARAAGFSMLNMPAELGGRDLSMLGQVALEEESGKATNGLGFAVVDRGPRELLELLTPAQVEKYVMPIVRGEYREAWALTEPGAGSDLAALAATAARDGDDWVLNGEKWFVTSEGDAGFYLVAAVHRRRAGAVPRRAGDARASTITRTPRFLHDPYLDHHPEIVLHRLPRARREPGLGRRRRLARVDPRRAALHRGPLLRRRASGCSARRPPGRRSAKRSAARSSRTRASRSRSPTRSRSSTPRGS